MESVTERDRHRIGCIGRGRGGELAEPGHDTLYLGLLGAAIATDGLFDGGRWVLVAGQSSLGSDE